MNGILLSPMIFAVAVFMSTCGGRPQLDKLDKTICATGTIIKPDCSPVVPPESGVVPMEIDNGRSKVMVRKPKGQTVYVEFRSEGYKKLYANLYSKDKEANIRFTRILLPDGTVAGPFFRDIEYDLPQDGVYKIAINENMVAGVPWSGDMKVQLVFRK